MRTDALADLEALLIEMAPVPSKWDAAELFASGIDQRWSTCEFIAALVASAPALLAVARLAAALREAERDEQVALKACRADWSKDDDEALEAHDRCQEVCAPAMDRVWRLQDELDTALAALAGAGPGEG